MALNGGGGDGQTEPLLEDSRASEGSLYNDSHRHRDGSDDARGLLSDHVTSGDGRGHHVPLVVKCIGACVSFLILGLFTSSTGALMSSLEQHYGLSDGQASAIFLSIPVGYVVAAHMNDFIHAKLGQRGIVVIGSLAHIISAVGAAAHPPFAVFCLAVVVQGFGYGIFDGSLSAWAAGVDNANTVSGFLHAAFCVGAAAGPSLVGMLLSSDGTRWYQWFYVMTGASFCELVALSYAFWFDDAARYAAQQQRDPGQTQGWRFLKYGSVWVCAAYLLAEVGTESAISGWIVVFMSRARHASQLEASVCSSAFWAGMAAGRLLLGPVNDRFGVRRAVALYMTAAMAMVAAFAVVEVLAASVALMVLVGFFIGPLYPACMVYLVALLPAEICVMAVSFVASMGQIGAAGFPAMLGLIAEKTGIRVFQAVIFVQIAIMLGLWIIFTRQGTA